MANTFLAFGIFAVTAAIVGGGLKAFGFEVGILKSKNRQILLASVGITLIAVSQWSQISPLVFPVKMVTETNGPTTLKPGEEHIIPVSLVRQGRLKVIVQTIVPDWASFTGPRGMPGQDGVFVRICGSESGGPCPNRQMGVSDAFVQELPAGAASVSVFNFASSPKMAVTLLITHPE